MSRRHPRALALSAAALAAVRVNLAQARAVTESLDALPDDLPDDLDALFDVPPRIG